MKQLWVDPLLWPGQPAPAKSGWSFDQSCHTLSGALLSGNASWITIQPSIVLGGQVLRCGISVISLPHAWKSPLPPGGLDELSRALFNGFSY